MANHVNVSTCQNCALDSLKENLEELIQDFLRQPQTKHLLRYGDLVPLENQHLTPEDLMSRGAIRALHELIKREKKQANARTYETIRAN